MGPESTNPVEQALEKVRQAEAEFGPESVQAIDALTALAGQQFRLHLLDEAEAVLADAHRRSVARAGPETGQALAIESLMASVVAERGDFLSAELEQRRVIRAMDAKGIVGRAQLLSRAELLKTLWKAGDFGAAADLLLEMVNIAAQTKGASLNLIVGLKRQYAQALRTLGKLSEALECEQEIVETIVEDRGPVDRLALEARLRMAMTMGALDNLSETMELVKTLSSDARLALKPSDPLRMTIQELEGTLGTLSPEEE